MATLSAVNTVIPVNTVKKTAAARRPGRLLWANDRLRSQAHPSDPSDLNRRCGPVQSTMPARSVACHTVQTID